MIIGLGSDIVNIDRISKLLEKQGNKFKTKIFTPDEIAAAAKYGSENKQGTHAYFARRFAAKEAFAKAAGTGFGKYLSFKDISTASEESGKPVIILNIRAKKLLQNLALQFMPGNNAEVTCHISLSDDYPYALAVVILEIC